VKRLIHVAASLSVTGCLIVSMASVSAASRDNSSPKPPKLHSGITLSIEDNFAAVPKDDPGRMVMERVAKQWATKTGNHVTFGGNPDGKQSKLCVDGPAGNGEDLIGVPHDQLSVMYACKVLAAVPSWAFPTTLQRKYAKTALLASKIAGKYYGMPWALETTGLWYNKALIPASAFKTSGNKPLAWSKLIPKLQKLTTNGQYGLGWKIDDFYFSYGAISNTGGYVFKITKKGFDYRRIGLDTTGAIRGIQFLKDMSTAGKYKLIPTSFIGAAGYDLITKLFDSGKMAVWLTGPWARPDMTKNGINVGFAPLPSVDGKHKARPFGGVQVYAVNQYSKHRNEAISLMSYLTQHLQQPDIKVEGRIPALKSLLASKAIQSDPVTRELAKAAIASQPMPNIPEMAKVWPPMANALSLVAKGELSPATAAHQAAQKIRSDIAATHGG